jgi:hypothetical protein
VSEIPQTTAVCDGTGEEFSLLNPHLEVSMRVVRQVLELDPLAQPVADEEADDDDMLEDNRSVYLATRAGRGRDLKFKDFEAAQKWFDERKGYTPKLQKHHEPETPYAGGDGVGEDSDEIPNDGDGE